MIFELNSSKSIIICESSLFICLFSKGLLLLKRKRLRLIRADCVTPAEEAEQLRLIQEFTTRMPTTRYAESEHPLAAINHPHYLVNSRKFVKNAF
jgi:hypothetical protein